MLKDFDLVQMIHFKTANEFVSSEMCGKISLCNEIMYRFKYVVNTMLISDEPATQAVQNKTQFKKN